MNEDPSVAGMRLDLLPETCLVDRALAIRIRGLQPGVGVTVRLCSPGFDGHALLSQAAFVADAAGVVDLTRHAPRFGSYQGVDAMGLFWSRVPVSAANAAAAGFVDLGQDPLTVTLTITQSECGPALSQRIRRSFAAEGVRSRDLCECGLVGRMFEPSGPGPHPAVLVVGGSNGGLAWSNEMASLLASHGYAALALAYFAAEGLPATLDRIPLEYFGTALEWLAAQPDVDARRIVVVGVSRGGELALLLGSTFARIGAVVAYVPSGILWPAYPPSGHGAWTLAGRELPYADVLTHAQWDQAVADGVANPDSFDWYLIPLRDAAHVAKVAIPVEKIKGPVLLISGAADGLWPSTALTEFALERFALKGFAHPVEHLRYEDAGHSVGWPHAPTTMLKSKHPVSGEEMDMGGTPEGTARARQDAWPRMLAFLESVRTGH